MAGLTKQHFEKIAEIINENHKRGQEFSWYELTESLSNYFKTQNPMFNENQFKKACLG